MGILDTLFGGNKGEQESVNKPAYDSEALKYLFSLASGAAGPEPNATPPEFKQFAPWKSLAGGDFDRLEESIYKGGADRLGRDLETATGRFRAQMRELGMADDPSYQKLHSETLQEPYTRGLTDLASSAASTRYGIEQDAYNNYNMGQTARGDVENTFNRGTFSDAWMPYLNKMQQFYSPVGVGRSDSRGTQQQFGGIIPGVMNPMNKFLSGDDDSSPYAKFL